MYKAVFFFLWGPSTRRARTTRRLIRESLRNLPKHMFSATLEDTIVYKIKLNSSSLSIHYERYVICFHYLIIPAITKTKRPIQFPLLWTISNLILRFTHQIPGCNVWHSESLLMNRLGCSTGNLGCVIDIVFIAPSFSCHSSSLHIP